MKPFRVGLALSGGGARGAVHVGVLKTFEREKIQINLITGTSVGALIGAWYAFSPDANALEKKINEYLKSDIFKSARFKIMESDSKKDQGGVFGRLASFFRKEYVLVKAAASSSILSQEEFSETINFFLEDKPIESAVIPFGAVATDLDTGEEIILRSGPVRAAVLASCALPGLVPPVLCNGRRLVDGFCSSRVPIDAAREMGADFVITVDMEQDLESRDRAETTLEIIIQAQHLLSRRLSNLQCEKTDFGVSLCSMPVGWSDIHKARDLFLVGEEAALSRVRPLKRAIAMRRMTSWIRRCRKPGKKIS
ncbi:MAG: patatin-like phospholipase family protein [Candidatus Aureabacteria bacterium]|nr:patatin-like phospholipase family protein [Candidatus Auribacterota bacterium]